VVVVLAEVSGNGRHGEIGRCRHIEAIEQGSWKMCVMSPPSALIGLLALAAGGAVAQTRLEPFSSVFEGRKSIAMVDARARAKVELRRSDTHAIYTVSTTVRWTVISRTFDQCGVVRFDGERIVPIEYVHIDHGQPSHNVRTEFDWPRGKAVTHLGDGSVRTADIAWPAWDPMSFQLALMAAAPSKRPGDQETTTVVERGVSKVHRVSYVGTTPSTSGTDERAFAIRSDKSTGGSVSLLLDAAHGFQPMRIGIEDVNLDRSSRGAPAAALNAGVVPRCPAPSGGR
jgi:hypothetical protein